MACSCRTAALRIFARSLAQVHAPTTQYARSAWLPNRPRLPSRNFSIASNYQQAHTPTEPSDVVAQGTNEQKTPPEDQHTPQPVQDLHPSSPQALKSAGGDGKLFSKKLRAKKAIRKAARYYNQPDSSLPSTQPFDVVAEGRKEQKTTPEDQHKPQPVQDLHLSSPQALKSAGRNKKLFSKKPRAKNAIRKAARYYNQPDSSLPSESQEQSDGNPNNGQKSRAIISEEIRQRKKAKRQQERAEKRAEQIERPAVKARDTEERTDERPLWLKQKQALKKKFPEGWRPPKRLSPDALEGIRVLHKQFPDMYTTAALAEKFEVSPEAIRRILRSKWEPNAEEEESREARWFKRGVSVWQRYAELGMQPPRKWREAGVQASPWEPSREEEHAEKEDVAGEFDPETAARLQAQMKLSKSLV